MIDNGDFSNGNTGFDTDYNYNASPSFPGNELIEGQCSIGTNPAPMHVNWVTCGDHTSGSGNMMLVNGSEFANQNAWCQTVNVTANTQYAFSVWVTSVDPNGPCEIQFNINGSAVGPGNVGLSATCQWINFFVLWDSGASTSAEICIEDINIAEFGNDFAIDDIVFAPTCTDSDEVILTPVTPSASADSESDLCVGETLNLVATGGMTYDWFGPTGSYFASGSNVNIFNVFAVDEGTYTVRVTDLNGCTAESTTAVIIHEPVNTDITEYTCDPAEEDMNVEFLVTSFGCDSVITTNIILSQTDIIQVLDTTCDPALAGVFTEDLTNQFGCDSMVTTTITLNPFDSIYIIETVCDSSAIDTIIQNLVNQFGCDSTVIIERMFNEADSTFLQNFTCDVTLEGIDQGDFININGCDSIVFTETIVIPADSTYLQNFSCDITAVGSFENLLINSNGCDSMIFTEVILIPADSTYLQDYSCDISAVGNFENLLINSNGCDSTVFTEVLLVLADSTYLQDYSCDMSAIGNFENLLINSNGCDSMVFTEVLFAPADSTYLQASTCDISAIGNFENLLINSEGCDSIVFTEVTLIPADSTYFQDFTCDMSATGNFENLLFNSEGCDSIVFTEVTLIPADSTYLQDYSCDITAIGNFENLLFNSEGCDSLIFTEVILLDSDSTNIESFTCDPNSVGIFVQDLINLNGCDSTVNTTILLSPSDTTYLSFETCDALEVGITTENESNQFGCDSTIITEIEYFSDLELGFFVSQPDCFITDQGSITGVVSGGSAPYLYSLDGASFQDDPQFNNLPSGQYEITVQDINGCIRSETIIINAISAVSVELGDDFTISIGDEAIIQSMINIPYDSLTSIVWTPLDDPDCANCLEQNVYPVLTTSYSISVTDVNGCESSDALTISVEIDQNVYVPNIFSPNGDGNNDRLIIFATEGSVKTISSFIGYDRWGNNIWNFENIQPNDNQYGWDGKYKGSQVNSGVYVWVATIDFNDGTNITLTGDVTVLR